MKPIQGSDQRDLGAFIPSVLDDYPLDPYEFRVYAHIARRAGSGHCWESMAAIAGACRMDIKTARKAVAFLTRCNLITCDRRPGQTDLITLTNHTIWASPEQAKKFREKRTPTRSGTPTPTKCGGGTPTRSGRTPLPDQVPLPLPNVEGVPLPDQVPKGTPYEGYPNEGTPIRCVERDAENETGFSINPQNAIATSPISPSVNQLAPAAQSKTESVAIAPVFSTEEKSFDLLDSLMEGCNPESESRYNSPISRMEARFRGGHEGSYPWRQNKALLGGFVQYLKNTLGRSDESDERKLAIAVGMVRNANYALPGEKAYNRINQSWLMFLANAQKSKSAEEAVGSKPLSAGQRFVAQRMAARYGS